MRIEKGYVYWFRICWIFHAFKRNTKYPSSYTHFLHSFFISLEQNGGISYNLTDIEKHSRNKQIWKTFVCSYN